MESIADPKRPPSSLTPPEHMKAPTVPSPMPPRSEFINDERSTPVEEGEIDAYMDSDNSTIGGGEFLTYLKRRLAEINNEYKQLMLAKIEFEAAKRDTALAQLRPAFADNYKSRKYLVKKLRELGEKINDKFVAG